MLTNLAQHWHRCLIFPKESNQRVSLKSIFVVLRFTQYFIKIKKITKFARNLPTLADLLFGLINISECVLEKMSVVFWLHFILFYSTFPNVFHYAVTEHFSNSVIMQRSKQPPNTANWKTGNNLCLCLTPNDPKSLWTTQTQQKPYEKGYPRSASCFGGPPSNSSGGASATPTELARKVSSLALQRIGASLLATCERNFGERPWKHVRFFSSFLSEGSPGKTSASKREGED